MSKRKKRLAKIRQNPKNVRFEELDRVLRDYGFERRQEVAQVTISTFFRAPLDRSVETSFHQNGLCQTGFEHLRGD